MERLTYAPAPPHSSTECPDRGALDTNRQACLMATCLLTSLSLFTCGALALILVPVSTSVGRWQVDAPGLDVLAPTKVLEVTLTDRTLSVGERSPDGRRRPPISYFLNPVATDAAVTGRTFRWLAADRMELHDVLINGRGRTAVTAIWELRDGGRTLWIRRTLRPLDDTSK